MDKTAALYRACSLKIDIIKRMTINRLRQIGMRNAKSNGYNETKYFLND